MIVGFTCGAFDIVHPGHMLMFKDAKTQCDYLIVGLQTDPTIDRPDKKNKPIQTIGERMIMLEGIKYIDELIIYDTEQDLYNLLIELKPDIRIIGDDWKDGFTGDDLPLETYWHTRSHNWSTTELRNRIMEDLK